MRRIQSTDPPACTFHMPSYRSRGCPQPRARRVVLAPRLPSLSWLRHSMSRRPTLSWLVVVVGDYQASCVGRLAQLETQYGYNSAFLLLAALASGITISLDACLPGVDALSADTGCGRSTTIAQPAGCTPSRPLTVLPSTTLASASRKTPARVPTEP